MKTSSNRMIFSDYFNQYLKGTNPGRSSMWVYIYNIIYFESGFIWNGVLTYKIFHIYFVPTKIFELIEN
jgi:hypothetical protein